MWNEVKAARPSSPAPCRGTEGIFPNHAGHFVVEEKIDGVFTDLRHPSCPRLLFICLTHWLAPAISHEHAQHHRAARPAQELRQDRHHPGRQPGGAAGPLRVPGSTAGRSCKPCGRSADAGLVARLTGANPVFSPDGAYRDKFSVADANSFGEIDWRTYLESYSVGGTTLANGCTSGHGVCGMSRLSRRSIMATASRQRLSNSAISLSRPIKWACRPERYDSNRLAETCLPTTCHV